MSGDVLAESWLGLGVLVHGHARTALKKKKFFTMTKPKKHAPKAVKGWAVVANGKITMVGVTYSIAAVFKDWHLGGTIVPVLITPIKRKAKR